MDSQAWALLAGVGVTVLFNWALLSYYTGKMTERVANHARWLSDLEETQNNHEKRLSRVEGRVGLGDEQWKR